MVKHQPEKNRFVWVEDNLESVLEYEVTGSSIDFTRTYVPNELRGRKIAETLVYAGLEWARSNDYQLSASCWYVDKFIKRTN